MESMIWDIRTGKITSLIKEDKRVDGRKLDEYRTLSIQKGISENADGSAKALLGETAVLSGVKMIPGEPYPDSPDEGTISVGAELLPLASPEYETGPPREDAIELARVVDRGIRESKTVDFKTLCVKHGELVWIVFIDNYVANDAGNRFDATSAAALAALNETKVPKLEDNKVVKHEYAGKLKLQKQPLLFTFAKIAGKIVADPTAAEEKAMDARFSCAIADDSTMSAFQKGLGGSFQTSEIDQCIEIAFKQAKEFRKLV